MTKVSDKLERRFVIPCGPMDVRADGVCKRQLKDMYDSILDRLTQEIHPEYVKPEHPDFAESNPQDELVNKALEDEDKGDTVVKTTKVKKPQYEGNSKLLQDVSGEIKKR